MNTTVRGSLMLLVLLLVAVPTLMPLFPSNVVSDDAPGEVFSAERAMQHLYIIAQEPHPQSSPAQAQVRDYLVQILTEIGLKADVQKASGAENVVTRLYGLDSTGAIVVLAHYDSVHISPGAADNSSATAALLEIIRALVAGPELRNDVIVLFDDGEELPDMYTGTKAFVCYHPWMSDVKVVISLDTVAPKRHFSPYLIWVSFIIQKPGRLHWQYAVGSSHSLPWDYYYGRD